MKEQSFGDKIIELIYPNTCVLCEKILVYGERRGICSSCEVTYPYLQDQLCAHCGKPLLDEMKEKCFDCRKGKSYYESGRSMWVYEEKVREALHAFKYKGHKEKGRLFAKELVRYYNRLTTWEVDCVIPVPLYRKKEKERGYNQAVLIGQYFARSYGVRFEKYGLIRIKATLPQKELKDQERLENMRQAFEAKEKVRGKKILLIDDIYTTGTTINACAKALKNKGASTVYYLAIGIGRGL